MVGVKRLSLEGRIPYGMRGLKYEVLGCEFVGFGSHPIRDAWIEIPALVRWALVARSHPIRDAWIEINSTGRACDQQTSRIPYGMRGLKSDDSVIVLHRVSSHPIRDAWIEIANGFAPAPRFTRSHPIRDAWIEIRSTGRPTAARSVASHTGCVD